MPCLHGEMANFAEREKSILVYTPDYCRAHIEFNRLYTVYLFEETFSKFMKQKLMLCISLDNFKTNQIFQIMKIKLFLETILGQNNFVSVCY